MPRIVPRRLVAPLAAAALITSVAACGGGATATPVPTSTPFPSAPTAAGSPRATPPAPSPSATRVAGGATATPSPSGAAASIQIATVDDQLEFDQAQLSARAGARVTITLKNQATSPALQHNWVLVKQGSEDAVANAGLAAGADKGWLPSGNPNVLASVPLTDGGKTTTVTFTAPAAGTYGFICTFPGHAATMHGTFQVR